MNSLSPSDQIYTFSAPKSDLVEVINRQGEKIMIQREVANLIESNRLALAELTRDVMQQREAVEKNNIEIDRIDSLRNKAKAQAESGVRVLFLNVVDTAVQRISLVFFFFNAQFIAAAVICRQVSSICAANWTKTPLPLKNTIKIIILCAAVTAISWAGVVACKNI